MNVDSFLISEYATLTDNDRSLTVVKTFNSVKSSAFPAVVPVLSLSAVIHAHRRERGMEHAFRIQLVNEKRETVSEQQGTFRFAGGRSQPGMPYRHLLVQRMVGARFKEPGVYAFELFIDETYHAGATISVQEA